jgi:hypothetical protein
MAEGYEVPAETPPGTPQRTRRTTKSSNVTIWFCPCSLTRNHATLSSSQGQEFTPAFRPNESFFIPSAPAFRVTCRWACRGRTRDSFPFAQKQVLPKERMLVEGANNCSIPWQRSFSFQQPSPICHSACPGVPWERRRPVPACRGGICCAPRPLPDPRGNPTANIPSLDI